LASPRREDGADRGLRQLGRGWRAPVSPTTPWIILFIVFSFLILLVTMVSFAFVFQLGEGPVQVALHCWDGDEHPLRYLGVGQVLVDRDTPAALTA